MSLFPVLRKDLPAVRIEGTGRVDGQLLARALLSAAQRRGAVVETGAVEEIVTSNGRASGVKVGGRLHEADAVVVATGSWWSDLIAPLGISLRVEPQRGQIIHLRLNGRSTQDWPIIQPQNGYYILAFEAGRIVVGATRETGSGLDYRVTAAGVAEVLKFGLSWAPGLADAEIIETRIGFRPMAFDNKPMLGAVPDIPGLFIGNGLGHSGLTLAPYVGKTLAQVVLGQPTDIDLSSFHPLRTE